jgi:hypothetical protein
MRPTQVLDRVNSNISQEPATVWMKLPTAEKTDAIHSVRKEPTRNGATEEVILKA